MKPPRQYRFRLEHMLAAIIEIRRLVAGKSIEDYALDQGLRWAVERGVEVLSEASRHIPDEVKATASEIEWPKVAGVGNILRHEYDRVADQVIYEIATEDLETLETAVRRLWEAAP